MANQGNTATTKTLTTRFSTTRFDHQPFDDAENVMQRPLIAVLIASALTLTGHAQAADLIQVYQQALANDATYASARNALTAGQERITQGRSQLLPGVFLQGSHTRFYGST